MGEYFPHNLPCFCMQTGLHVALLFALMIGLNYDPYKMMVVTMACGHYPVTHLTCAASTSHNHLDLFISSTT